MSNASPFIHFKIVNLIWH